MPLDPKVQSQLSRLLLITDDAGARGQRLIEDARRLWKRTQTFVAMQLIPTEVDADALELACHAVELPLRMGRPAAGRRGGQLTLRERCEQAAELLITWLGEHADEAILDRTARVLRETPHRSPMIEEARLLSDVVNLDDFGITGATLLAMQLGRQNASVEQLVDALAKRDEYGYWEARLKDGFHFEAVRDLARARVNAARQLAEALARELRQDGAD